MCEGVDGSDNVSGYDKEVPEESCTGSFTSLSSPWENVLSSNAGVVVMKCGD